MKSEFNFKNNQSEIDNSQGRVKVTDLLSRLNEEKKNRKKKKFSFKCRSCIRSYRFWNNSYNIILIIITSFNIPLF